MQGNLDPASSVTQYAQALPTSDFSMLYDSNGNSLNVQPGNNFAVSYNGGTTYHIYEYQPSGTAPTDGTEGFSTINDLITKMNQDIKSDTGNASNSVSFNNGQITIANGSQSDISIKVMPTSQVPAGSSLSPNANPLDNTSLNTLMESLNQPIAPGQSISSSTINNDSYTMQATFYDS
ncbi:hypothetical protein, partial [Desulfurella amilsii]